MSSGGNLCCVLYGPGKVRFEDRPEPLIEEPHDVLVRVAYVGVCGSDVHFWAHGGILERVSEEHPLVMGHEASGVVHSVGSSVTSVRPGDRVAIEPGFPCRRCNQCKAGRYNLCPDMIFAADPPHNHGTLARLFKIPDDFVYKIPDTLTLQEAVLVEPLAVAVHGVRLSGLAPGQNVLVQGCGTIGLLTAATARAFGAKTVCITDINSTKLDFAKGFIDCCTFLSNTTSSPRNEAERIKTDNNLPHGADIVLECTGVESSIQAGLYASATGGVLVQVGMGKPDITVPLMAMCFKETVVKTAFRYSPGDYDLALELLRSGKISVKSLISNIVPFEKADEAWIMTQRGEGIKNIIQGVQD